MRRITIPMPFPVPAQERYVPYDMMLNDVGFWYPILLRTGVRVPATIMVNLGPSYNSAAKRIKQAMDEIGYPCFFRGCNIAASLKHYWGETCFIDKPLTESQILQRMHRVVQYCVSANQGAEALLYENWAIREYIEADTTYMYREMPLKMEIRAFIKDNRVVCMHHYWENQIPEGVVAFSGDQLKIVYDEAQKVAKKFYGYWSCDFMLSKTGEWYALDMALGEDSFHPTDCQKLTKDIVNTGDLIATRSA